MNTEDLLSRVNLLISKGHTALSTKQHSQFTSDYVASDHYTSFRSAGLSFILSLFGEKHPYYSEFNNEVNNYYNYNITRGIGILESVKNEIQEGWLVSFRGLVTAEVFADFLEMSRHLLDENYKDPAAVMIGSVLEEHLRRLCSAHSVNDFVVKNSDIIPKRADAMNIDLMKAGVYNLLQQKSITAWLDLRNKAAHGKYSEYTIEQVNLMYQGVLDFVNRFN